MALPWYFDFKMTTPSGAVGKYWETAVAQSSAINVQYIGGIFTGIAVEVRQFQVLKAERRKDVI